jgi:hypothetical protein
LQGVANGTELDEESSSIKISTELLLDSANKLLDDSADGLETELLDLALEEDCKSVLEKDDCSTELLLDFLSVPELNEELDPSLLLRITFEEEDSSSTLEDESSEGTTETLSSSPQAAKHRNATRAKILHLIVVLPFYTQCNKKRPLLRGRWCFGGEQF